MLADQSDVGNNYNSVHKMHLFNLKLRRKLKYVDAIYYCPYDESVINRSRKPFPGMVQRAAQHFNLDLAQCIVVGDSVNDVLMAENAKVPRKVIVSENEFDTGGIQYEMVASLADVIL